MCPKKLTRIMKIELSSKCKIKPEDYRLRRNTIDEICLVDIKTGKETVFSKSEYRLKIDPYNWR